MPVYQPVRSGLTNSDRYRYQSRKNPTGCISVTMTTVLIDLLDLSTGMANLIQSFKIIHFNNNATLFSCNIFKINTDLNMLIVLRNELNF